MKLIIGLGNSGYDRTRHNVGFMMLDRLAQNFGAPWHDRPRFRAHIAELELSGQKVLFAKPTTYYNLSGEAVRALRDFYKLTNDDVLVIHDELALPLGTVRTRGSGSDAGNNGIRNVNAHIGPDYTRIRIGTATDQLQHKTADQFVLDTFTSAELKQLDAIAEHVERYVEDFIHEDRDFAHTSLKIDG